VIRDVKEKESAFLITHHVDCYAHLFLITHNGALKVRSRITVLFIFGLSFQLDFGYNEAENEENTDR
jgi:hypothetical protein